MSNKTWINYYKKPELNKPIAIVGSPGLRSIGNVVIDYLIKKMKPELMGDLYSSHFPAVYQTSPIYAAHPRLPGIGGVMIKPNEMDFPKVQFYYKMIPPLIITKGYHPNFEGQYEVAENVIEVYKKFNVYKIIVVAGYGLKGKEICCAATNVKILEEIKEKFKLEVDYTGPFYGFSGLIFGMAKLKGIDAFTLFAKTESKPENPESVDEEASKKLFEKIIQIINSNYFH
jgi:proteasome assembly chaperone (PAC2) family protein